MQNKIEHAPKGDFNKKIILYTGTLNWRYGIRELVEAFQLIKNDDYILRVCGSGEASQYLKNLCSNSSNIEYFGQVDNQISKEMQQRATVLVNPRRNIGDYVKYSFPSKIMEYMLSGTPVITYKLPGIPKDYDDFLYYVEGDSVEDLYKKITTICEKPYEELYEFGYKAQKFIINNKNNIVQSRKIIDFLSIGVDIK